MVSTLRFLLVLAVASNAANPVVAKAAACATECTTDCISVDVPSDTDTVIVKKCSSGEYPYIDSIKVDSADADVFTVTTYTNGSMTQHFPDCYLTRSDGCEVSTTKQCGLSVGENTLVVLSCQNPAAACELRYDIEFLCAEIPTASSASSSTGSSASSSSLVTGSSASSANNGPSASSDKGSSASSTTEKSASSATESDDSSASTSAGLSSTKTPASTTTSRPSTWSTSSPTTSSSSTSASNSTDVSGAMSLRSWQMVGVSMSAVLGFSALFA